MLRGLRAALNLQDIKLHEIIGALIAVGGAIASALTIPDDGVSILLVCIFSGLFILFIVFDLILPWKKWQQVPYYRSWAKMEYARPWIARQFQGRIPHVRKWGVKEITVIGVACTEIGYLFRTITKAVNSGISFRIIMVNPQNTELMQLLRKYDIDEEVQKLVQEPLAADLRKLVKYYNDCSNNRMEKEITPRINRLVQGNYMEHKICIEVCREMWQLAETEGKSNNPSNHAQISVYYCDEPPWAHQWIFGAKTYIFSPYTGFPGVGVDNPAFCTHVGVVAGDRAHDYATWLVQKCCVAP